MASRHGWLICHVAATMPWILDPGGNSFSMRRPTRCANTLGPSRTLQSLVKTWQIFCHACNPLMSSQGSRVFHNQTPAKASGGSFKSGCSGYVSLNFSNTRLMRLKERAGGGSTRKNTGTQAAVQLQGDEHEYTLCDLLKDHTSGWPLGSPCRPKSASSFP